MVSKDLPLWGAWRLESTAQLTAEAFPAVRESLPFTLLDGQLSVVASTGPGEADVALTVTGARARVTDVELNRAAAVPRNQRIRYQDWAGRAAPPANVFAGDGHLRVSLRFADDFIVEGEALRLVLGGGITVDRRDDEATVQGAIEVSEGRFPLFENPFVVERGRLTMLGGNLESRRVIGDESPRVGAATLSDPDEPVEPVPLEPIIELRASGAVVDTAVQVVIEGPTRRPELVLTSQPRLPAYQIMTLLITWKVDAVDDRNGDVRRQVAKLVNRFHNPSLSRQLYDRLGVDKLGLGFGSSVTQPILTVGKQLNRLLYVETVYHHNAPPDQNEKEGHVEYQLGRAWTLDTVYGDAAQGSVGFFWRTAWGAPDEPVDAPAAAPPATAPGVGEGG